MGALLALDCCYEREDEYERRLNREYKTRRPRKVLPPVEYYEVEEEEEWKENQPPRQPSVPKSTLPSDADILAQKGNYVLNAEETLAEQLIKHREYSSKIDDGGGPLTRTDMDGNFHETKHQYE
eukprot:gnl/MRDRNA2_/MRDRNA2_89245_c0_seq1.p1 gnl/MRDRNA2_/MRDRNA2_89245_c0~~gnl/MRDRNA2_/MRDRNA2_89245_c0_seq1.p1  ORF type:complete len:124 (-),score=30.11 gnl/MRDRNA2_/MRDRNA2_89245_c0_seq1:35-406(-)